MSYSPETASPVRMPKFIEAIDAFNRIIGRFASWLMLPVVFICFIVVMQRYLFGVGYIWLQELFIWLHGAAFMLAAGYALGAGAHVRVDVFYNRVRPRTKAWINTVGVLLLLFVMCFTLLWLSYPQVTMSWKLGERSTSMSGLPYAYVLKTFIPIFCIVVILQGISMLARNIAVICGRTEQIIDPLKEAR